MAVNASERGSLHSGLGEWIVQRVTAVYILVYMVAAVIRLASSPVDTHAEWQSLSSGIVYQVATLLFVFSLLAHSWLGLKSVFLDYLKSWRLRFLLLMLLATVLSGIGAWALLVVAG